MNSLIKREAIKKDLLQEIVNRILIGKALYCEEDVIVKALIERITSIEEDFGGAVNQLSRLPINFLLAFKRAGKSAAKGGYESGFRVADVLTRAIIYFYIQKGYKLEHHSASYVKGSRFIALEQVYDLCYIRKTGFGK